MNPDSAKRLLKYHAYILARAVKNDRLNESAVEGVLVALADVYGDIPEVRQSLSDFALQNYAVFSALAHGRTLTDAEREIYDGHKHCEPFSYKAIENQPANARFGNDRLQPPPGPKPAPSPALRHPRRW
jgi:hypothetical protein